jgi:DGQHR domain-containing protein
VPALRVRQWLASWEGLDYDEKARRRKPEDHFYLASIPAGKLRALAGIYRRDDSNGRPRQWELGIQRTHDRERSEEISEYVRNGFPWSELSASKRASREFDDLRKPGWLPTAIVVNVLHSGEERQRQRLDAADAIDITAGADQFAELKLPAGFDDGWHPSSIPPIEVIDGQHRLWAFNPDDERDFDLPVVLFHGLDISWQAYLFYSINITPKKINRSLAYDLYPLLRSEDWLERFEGTPVYRESRAQELTEALWAVPESPWHDRINMLGRRGVGGVTQAAWIRSLMATLVRTYDGPGVRRIGGLFGARRGEDELALDWSAAQQAAFLIMFWTELFDAIREREPDWAYDLAVASVAEREGLTEREVADEDVDIELAVSGPNTLLNSDQGVRGALHVVNDLFFVQAESLSLPDWVGGNLAGISEGAVVEELEDLEKRDIGKHLREVAVTLSEYDWRSSNAPGLGSEERKLKARFRGSGGYKELRKELTEFLVDQGPKTVSDPANFVFELLGFDE